MSNFFSALELDVRPGLGLGHFELGSSLWNVLDILRQSQHLFPLVEVKFDPDSPVTPVMLHVRPHLDLLFSGLHQRLHTICVRGLREASPPVILKFKDNVLSSPEEVLRRVGVSLTFGPTYQGEDLQYPGVSFSFDEDGRAEGRKAPTPQHEDKMQEVKRVFVTQKKSESTDVLSEVPECPSMFGDVRQAIAKVHEGATLNFYPSTSLSLRIQLGVTTAQDLTCDLGPPLRVHYKEDDRMSIHSRTNSPDEATDTDYFYNYLQHGIDFLICGTTHIVKKIVMHSNIPGTPLFQRYKRCPWEVEAVSEDGDDELPPRASFFDRIEDISRMLTLEETTPPSMQFNRTDEERGLTLPASKSRLVGFNGVILEVTESSHVAAITLY